MITLEASNRYVYVRNATNKILRKLEKITSYKVTGYYFSPAYKNNRWDGREHLLRYHKGVNPGYRAPIGLLGDMMECLDENNIKYELDSSNRRQPTAIKIGWNEDVVLREYQKEVILKTIEADKWNTGLGIVKMPIRSGKTKTFAGIAHCLQVRTLFIVPSKMLLYQSHKALEETLAMPIGIVGDSTWDEKDVTVASIQTLASARGGVKEIDGRPLKKTEMKMVKFKSPGNYNPSIEWKDGRCWLTHDGDKMFEPLVLRPLLCNKSGKAIATLSIVKHRGGTLELKKSGVERINTPMDPRYKAMLKKYDLMCIDEVHHLKGDAWHKTIMDFDAMYRIGLSATAYLDCEQENGRGVIWLKACCGDICAEISTSRLINEGFLLRPTIMMYRIKSPSLHNKKWSGTLQRDAIYMNEYRNDKIIRATKVLLKRNLQVLITTNRIEQTDWLLKNMTKAGIAIEAITGATLQDERNEIIERYVKKKTHVLIGTVFGEGVDIPVIEGVINAEGGMDAKATVQRMRNLTPAEDKTSAVFIDFYDMMNEYFEKHSQKRLETYQSESAFKIKMLN